MLYYINLAKFKGKPLVGPPYKSQVRTLHRA